MEKEVSGWTEATPGTEQSPIKVCSQHRAPKHLFGGGQRHQTRDLPSQVGEAGELACFVPHCRLAVGATLVLTLAWVLRTGLSSDVCNTNTFP